MDDGGRKPLAARNENYYLLAIVSEDFFGRITERPIFLVLKLLRRRCQLHCRRSQVPDLSGLVVSPACLACLVRQPGIHFALKKADTVCRDGYGSRKSSGPYFPPK